MRRSLLALPLVALMSATAFAQNWARTNPTNKPAARAFSAAVYEWRRQRVLMFGGGTRQNFAQFTGTWAWNGKDWTKLTTRTTPPGRSSHAMAYDFARGRTVMFGGYTGTSTLGDTWEFNGVDWVKRSPKTNPPPRSGQKMVYDTRRRVVVMFAGTSPTQNDTWEWNGNDWKQVTTKNRPTPRCYHGAAFDEQRNEMVVYGGYRGGGVADTWAYNGSDWRQVATTGPGARFAHEMVYDPRRQRIVMVSGFGGTGHTWEWNGYAWSQITTVTSPTAAGYFSLAYDLARDHIVRFAGEPVINETWIFDNGTRASYAAYGKGCAGSNGLPTLAGGTQRPVIGTLADVTLANARKSSPVLFVFGASSARWGPFELPLDLTPFGASGCSVLAALDFLTARSTSASGAATIKLPIPRANTLVGIPFYNQWLVPDPGQNKFGIVVSNGGKAIIGSK